MKSIKAKALKEKRRLTPNSAYSNNFTEQELDEALKSSKTGKSAGYDGMYAEFLKHLGPVARLWLLALFNNILSSASLPKLFKQAKVIAIKKPGQAGVDAEHYLPIALLIIVFELLGRLLQST